MRPVAPARGYSLSTNASASSSQYWTMDSENGDAVSFGGADSTPRLAPPAAQQPRAQLSLPYGSSTSFATGSFVSAYSQTSVYSPSPVSAPYGSAMLSPVPSVPSVNDGTAPPFPSPSFLTLPQPLQGRPKSMPLSPQSDHGGFFPERSERDILQSVSSPVTPVTPYTPSVPAVPQVPSVPSSPIPPQKPPPTGPLPATPPYPPSLVSVPRSAVKRSNSARNSRRPLPPAMTDELRQILRQSQQKAKEEDAQRASIPAGGSLGRNSGRSIQSAYRALDGKGFASVDGLPQHQQAYRALEGNGHGSPIGNGNGHGNGMADIMTQHHQNHTQTLDPPRRQRESYNSFKNRQDLNKF